MSDSSKKGMIKEESKIINNSEIKDNVDAISSSQNQVQESHLLNSSSNSQKQGSKQKNIEKKEKEKEEESEYDDVYVVEERTVPTAEIDNQEDEDMNEELTLSLSSEDENFELINSDFDKIKLASEKSKRKLEKKKDIERLDKILEEKVEFIPKTIKRDEVVEDFIRNFFTSMHLNKTLDEFNQEYAELSKKGRFNDNYLGPITDIFIKNAKLEEKLERMQKELDKANKNAEEVKSNWENLRKERDFHKENYLKTVEEKTNIANDIKTLQNLHNDFTSKIADLNLKYEHLCKNKSLMKLDLEKMKKEKERREQFNKFMKKFFGTQTLGDNDVGLKIYYNNTSAGNYVNKNNVSNQNIKISKKLKPFDDIKFIRNKANRAHTTQGKNDKKNIIKKLDLIILMKIRK